MQNDMRDRHLVTDKPKNMTESMLNFAYAKNEKVYLMYANGTEDIDLCEYISHLTEKGCKLSADDVMNGSCIEGCDCEMAVLYTLAVQAAELRERLKYYESLEEQGQLIALPCKVGDIVYLADEYYHCEAEIEQVVIDENGISFEYVQYDRGVDTVEVWDDGQFGIEDIGTKVYLTLEDKEKSETDLLNMEVE